LTIYGSPVQGQGVLGAQLHPNFSQQNAGGAPAAVTVSPPANMPLMESMSRGVVPRNANVSSINGVSTGLNNPTPIADLCTNGAGAQLNLGVAVPGVAGNPASNGANDLQEFVDGTGAQAQQVNGPTPTSTETLTSAPVSTNTTCGNVSLAGSYQG
jgi:hypothetical protein